MCGFDTMIKNGEVYYPRGHIETERRWAFIEGCIAGSCTMLFAMAMVWSYVYP